MDDSSKPSSSIKIMVALLTHHDSPRLLRLIECVKGMQTAVGFHMEPVVVVNTLNPDYEREVLDLDQPFPVHITESNGRPGKGKNACHKVFLDSDCDYLSQIDGDDMLYPTYFKSLAQHISLKPHMDVLGIIPNDVVNITPSLGYKFTVPGGLHAGVWGTSMCAPTDKPGPGESHVFTTDLPSSVDYIILQSRAAASHMLDEELGVGEDHLYTYQLLGEHQKGKLNYYHTMSSDMYLIDKTTENSVQRQYPQHQHVERLRNRVLDYVPRHRSSAFELPVIYLDLLFNQFDKEQWAIQLYTDNPL